VSFRGRKRLVAAEPTVVLARDGGFHSNIQELRTVVGIPAQSIGAPSDIGPALPRLWEQALEPALLQGMVDTYANDPKLAFGWPNTEKPFAAPSAWRGHEWPGVTSGSS
jgi:hypothetical protein